MKVKITYLYSDIKINESFSTLDKFKKFMICILCEHLICINNNDGNVRFYSDISELEVDINFNTNLNILVYDRDVYERAINGDIVRIRYPPNDLMYCSGKQWHKILKCLRPRQHKLEMSGTIMYIEFSFYRKKYKSRTPIRVLRRNSDTLLISATIPNIYGYGFGPSGPCHYYYLFNNGNVEPLDYKYQNLSKPLPIEFPEKSDYKSGLFDYSKWIDITSELPDTCKYCKESNYKNHKMNIICHSNVDHEIICNNCIKCNNIQDKIFFI